MGENMHVHYSAEQYDEYTAHSVETYDNRMVKRLKIELKFLPPGPKNFVDVGTGTARLLIQFAQEPEFNDFTLIGTDYFEDMVAKARETVAEAGLSERIRIDQNDVHALPYPDEFAHVVISRSTIHHWAEPEKALAEIHRILKPGGVAVLHEPRRNPHPKALAEFNRQRAELGVPPADLDEKYTPEEVWEFLKLAGVDHQSNVFAPKRGPGSLGFEVRICKCPAFYTYLVKFIGHAKMMVTSW